MHLSALQEDLEFIAGYDLPYEQLKGKNILVTGATGLIGASLVRALLAIGDEVTIRKASVCVKICVWLIVQNMEFLLKLRDSPRPLGQEFFRKKIVYLLSSQEVR